MSMPHAPRPAKLVVGVVLKDRALFPGIASELEAAFGVFDVVSPWLAFDGTSYYEKEMGAPLWRRMLAFRPLIEQDQLADVKLAANAMEQIRSVSGRREANIDPGYLLLERLVLATGKNYSHRIYIGRGIYADLTLIYQRGAYRALPWTYPDYAGEPMRRFLVAVRRKYAVDIRGETPTS
ncbi:MAG: hypothetical protein H6R38_538 [Deltaproteobacteria bacterium]|nr:hypothetical protein [Deltaproteobacteria bacterium]